MRKLKEEPSTLFLHDLIHPMTSNPVSDSGTATPIVEEVTSENVNSHRITDDDLYRHSSQYRVWSFTPEQLARKRTELNAQACKRVEQHLLKFKQENQGLTSEELEAVEKRAIPITVDEELLIVNFYAKKVQLFAAHLNLPTEVTATAISFFRKFFLVNSAMEIHPKEILLTALFLACKSENYFIGVESFAKKSKTTVMRILKYEFRLLESLQFTLLNHHPYRPLHGFFLDIQNVLQGKVDLKYMSHVYSNCKKLITDALLTDVIYLYTPPQITLATLLIEDEVLTTRYLELKFGSNEEEKAEGEKNIEAPVSTMPKYQRLLDLIQSCKDIISVKPNLSKEAAIAVDAKIQLCQTPMKVVEHLRRQRASSSTPDSSTSKEEPDAKKRHL